MPLQISELLQVPPTLPARSTLQASSSLQSSLGSSPTRIRAPAIKKRRRRSTPKQDKLRRVLSDFDCSRWHISRVRERKRLWPRSRPRSARVGAIKHSCDYSFRSSVAYLNQSQRDYRTEQLLCPDGCTLFQGFKSIPILRGRLLSIIRSCWRLNLSSSLPAGIRSKTREDSLLPDYACCYIGAQDPSRTGLSGDCSCQTAQLANECSAGARFPDRSFYFGMSPLVATVGS
jgi:hypothetical protein